MLQMHTVYSNIDTLKLVPDAPPSLRDLAFSRIYGKNKNISNCDHISGRMAHRLFLQGVLLVDFLKDDFDLFFTRLFVNDNDESNIFIKRSYFNFMSKSEHFQQLIAHSLNRILCRLIKGFGFKCNCIAEKLLAYQIIVMAQDALIDRTEKDHFAIEGKFDTNEWQFEKINKTLDENFLLIFESELALKINKSINKVDENTYKFISKNLLEWTNIVHYIELNNPSKRQYMQLRGIDISGFDDESKLDNRMEPKENALLFFNKSREKMEFLTKYKHCLVDYDNSKIGKLFLIHCLNLDNIQPSKWFVPFDDKNVMDFYWSDVDLKRVKARKRCVVCKKRNSKRKNINLKKCKNCKSSRYCNKKCQKYHWKYSHRSECSYWCDIDKLGWEKATTKHMGVDFNKFGSKAAS
eukprot:165034_1